MECLQSEMLCSNNDPPSLSTFEGSSGHKASSCSMCGGIVVTTNVAFRLFLSLAAPMDLDEIDLLSVVAATAVFMVVSLSLLELILAGLLELPPSEKRLRALVDAVNRLRYVLLTLVSRETLSVPSPLLDAMMFDSDCSSAAKAFSSFGALACMMQSSHHASAMSNESHMCTALRSSASSSMSSSTLPSWSSTIPSNLPSYESKTIQNTAQCNAIKRVVKAKETKEQR